MEVLGFTAVLAFATLAVCDFVRTGRVLLDDMQDQKRREAELLRRTRMEIEA